MKKTVIALACVLASTTAFAASMTNGTGWSNTTGNGTYKHTSTNTTVTDRKTKIIKGNKSSTTKYRGTLVEREGYLGETSMSSGSSNIYMGTGAITQGAITAWNSGSDKVIGHPWEGGFGEGNKHLDKGYKGGSLNFTSTTKSKTPKGKETVTTIGGWSESGYFSRSETYGGNSTTVYAE